MKNNQDYQIIEYYDTFFAHVGYILQKRKRFWFFGWHYFWITIETDTFGYNLYKWKEHFGCPVIYLKDVK